MSILKFLGIIAEHNAALPRQSLPPARRRKLFLEALEGRAVLSGVDPLWSDSSTSELTALDQSATVDTSSEYSYADTASYESADVSTLEPSGPVASQPADEPVSDPAEGISSGPAAEPTSSMPESDPSVESGDATATDPAQEPSSGPVAEPAPAPTEEPTVEPVDETPPATTGPAPAPAEEPTAEPTEEPQEEPVGGQSPTITSLEMQRYGGWVAFFGTATDDESPQGLIVEFASDTGVQFRATINGDGSFSTTLQRLPEGTQVTAYFIDADGNYSDTVSLIV